MRLCGAQLGDYKCTAPFGVITDCNSPDFNGVDGILGFGLPKAGEEGRELPTPILFAMTDMENKMSNARDLTRKFSFFSTDTDAEVQLGGYDPATTVGEMWYTPCLSENDFIVGVTSLRFGHTFGESEQLLKFDDQVPARPSSPSMQNVGLTLCGGGVLGGRAVPAVDHGQWNVVPGDARGHSGRKAEQRAVQRLHEPVGGGQVVLG